MEELLKKIGYTNKDIKKEQLIIVKIGEAIYLYDNNKLYDKISQFYIGKNGATNKKTEGDGKTPYGLYDIGFAFGTQDLSNVIKYPYRKITENSYWVDDINSNKYNQWVESSIDKDWKSAEHLIEYPIQYKYGLVIEYNTKTPIKGLGSAIFMHVYKNTYTAGCIAVSESDMLKILKWVRDAQILIL